MTQRVAPPTAGIPWLEFFAQQDGPVQKTLLTSFPFSIGRNDTTDLPINSTRVSREHALIVRAGNTYRVRDLDSTNGTFLNGQRIEEATLNDGDMLAVGDVEFTFFSGTVQTERKTVTQVINFRESNSTDLQAADVIRCVRRLQETLLQGGGNVGYRPIVQLATGKPIGLEALARTSVTAANDVLAERQLLAAPSRLAMRVRASHAALAAGRVLEASLEKLFLPLQANELEPRIIESLLSRITGILPQPGAIVLDIPDSSVNDIPFFHDLYAAVREAGALLCYSEFAAGKAQLEVHGKVPPAYVKLSRSMLRGLANDAQRQSQIKTVLRSLEEHGSQPIAVEIDGEPLARVFRRLGCPLGMGSYFDSTESSDGSSDFIPTERYAAGVGTALGEEVRTAAPAL